VWQAVSLIHTAPPPLYWGVGCGVALPGRGEAVRRQGEAGVRRGTVSSRIKSFRSCIGDRRAEAHGELCPLQLKMLPTVPAGILKVSQMAGAPRSRTFCADPRLPH
jgi:hypothetical protein